MARVRSMFRKKEKEERERGKKRFCESLKQDETRCYPIVKFMEPEKKIGNNVSQVNYLQQGVACHPCG